MQEGMYAREWMQQIIRTRMAFRKAVQSALKERNTGITFEMLQVLSSLWQEQGISQQILAERTAKGKACLTNLMTNLEKKGLVRREEDRSDRRNKRVFLTQEGVLFKEKINPILYDVYGFLERKMGLSKVKGGCLDLKELHDVLESY